MPTGVCTSASMRFTVVWIGIFFISCSSFRRVQLLPAGCQLANFFRYTEIKKAPLYGGSDYVMTNTAIAIQIPVENLYATTTVCFLIASSEYKDATCAAIGQNYF